MKDVVYCLIGPTASGKTQLAVELVQRFPFAIISVDSAMVYREMDIGTAKPTANILQIAPHRLINIRDPKEAYSAAQFCKDALHEIAEIRAQGKIPLLVGGTMLYFRALQQGLSELPTADASVRDALTKEAEAMGWPEMHKKLMQSDPVAANRIHPHDGQRIQRALEVFIVTGKSLTTWLQQEKEFSKLPMVNIAIAPNDRTILHERIQKRFLKMLEDGFVEEVEKLFFRGDLSRDLPSMRSVGYRQVWDYLSGDCTRDEMCERGIIATRQFAKRQLTWLRSWPDLRWFDSESENLVEQIAKIQ